MFEVGRVWIPTARHHEIFFGEELLHSGIITEDLVALRQAQILDVVNRINGQISTVDVIKSVSNLNDNKIVFNSLFSPVKIFY